jgi:sec-independent protein translocase protein TatA
MPELLLILAVFLLIFGAKRLPEIGSAIGKSVRELKRGLTDTSDAIMRNDRNDDDQRNLTSRQMDASQPPASTGEPKRLSQ